MKGKSGVDQLSPVDRWWVLLHYAVMAPSGHNAQPWLFRIRGNMAELRADRRRSLPVVDPDDRELVIGCGAALLNLRLAIHHFGFADQTTLLPDPADRDLLARIEIVGDGRIDPAEETLFDAIPERRTNRLAFAAEPLPPSLLEDLESAAASEGAWLAPLRALSDRKRVADLIVEGDLKQAANPALRVEMAAWVHGNSSLKRDGLRGYSFGYGHLESVLAPLYVRLVDWGEAQSKRDRGLAVAAPVLAVLGTPGDTVLDWLHAGQALARVLLLAQAAGISASFFNQPVEVPELRHRLLAYVAASGSPQLCFRLGRGKPVMPSPRRQVEDVVSGV
jgi:hypothetical protein